MLAYKLLTLTSSCFFIRLQTELISDLSIHHSCLVFPVTYTASPLTWCFSLSPLKHPYVPMPTLSLYSPFYVVSSV